MTNPRWRRTPTCSLRSLATAKWSKVPSRKKFFWSTYWMMLQMHWLIVRAHKTQLKPSRSDNPLFQTAPVRGEQRVQQVPCVHQHLGQPRHRPHQQGDPHGQEPPRGETQPRPVLPLTPTQDTRLSHQQGETLSHNGTIYLGQT